MDGNPVVPARVPRRVVLATWGTAGDIAPYTGLAAGLMRAGHEVVVVTSDRYSAAFRGLGLTVCAMPFDRHEAAIGQFTSRRARTKNSQEMAVIAAEHLLMVAGRGADVLLAHPLLHPQAALIGRGLGISCIGVYTVSHAMMLPRLVAGNPRWRYTASDALVKVLLAPVYKPAASYLGRELGLPGSATENSLLSASRGSVRYGFSTVLLPPRVRFPALHRVVGAWQPHRVPHWQPEARLVDFLEAGPAPIYFGFGSMAGVDVEKLAESITQVVRRLGVRAVVQGGYAGLAGRGEDIFNIGECPHEWLFPQMRAAVHHAGPGTTHACLRAGTPSLPVPVGLDQPLWGARLHALGLTSAVIPQRQLNGDNLAWALGRLLEEEGYRARTRDIGRMVEQQDGTAVLQAELGRPVPASGR
ncbi:glycosyltransferase [Streptomyces sp. NPDC001903]|uniref:glycosyltransferase n=1 Tax=Streptomyces sp. NPDC001903 TaxID=3364622 RepID=UPI0036D0532E